MLIIFYTVVLLCLLKYIWRQRKFYWASWHLDGPFAWPIIGNGNLVFKSDVLSIINNLRKTYAKPLIRIWIGIDLMIFIEEPDFIQTILTNPNCADKGKSYRFFQDIFGENGLILLKANTSNKWKFQRKLFNPLFGYYALNTYMKSLNENCNKFISKLHEFADGNTFDIFPQTLQHSFKMLFDATINTSHNETKVYLKNLYKIHGIVAKRTTKLWVQPNLLFKYTKLYKLQKQCMSTIFNVVETFLHERILNTKDQGINEPILIDKIIQFQEEKLLGKTDGIHQINTFLIAGFETTGSNISCACLTLAMYPEYQRRLYEEIRSVFPEQNSIISLDDLNKLSYLDMYVKEVLRLFPSVPLISRVSNKDILLGNTIIPAGTELVLNIHHLHRNKKYQKNIENPEEFNPDNFLPDKVSERHRYSFIPFSSGPRNCIGMRFAIIVIKLTLINIIRNFRLSTGIKLEDLKFRMFIKLQIINKFLICLHKRSDYNA